MAIKIKLTKGKYAIVDDEDYPYLNRFVWGISKTREGILFAIRQVRISNGKAIYLFMQELLIKKERQQLITFKNKNTLDLRKDNLLAMNRSHISNRFKKKKGNFTSKYKGVCLGGWKKNRWIGQIVKDKKIYTVYRGYSEKEAAICYNKKALELFGEFAYQNKI